MASLVNLRRLLPFPSAVLVISADGQLDPGGGEIIADIPPVEARVHHEDLSAGNGQQEEANGGDPVGALHPTGVRSCGRGGVILRHGTERGSGGDGTPESSANVASLGRRTSEFECLWPGFFPCGVRYLRTL